MKTLWGALVVSVRTHRRKGRLQRSSRRPPRSGFPLYGIAMASERSGDSKAAATEHADFMSAWKSADPHLPQIATPATTSPLTTRSQPTSRRKICIPAKTEIQHRGFEVFMPEPVLYGSHGDTGLMPALRTSCGSGVGKNAHKLDDPCMKLRSVSSYRTAPQ